MASCVTFHGGDEESRSSAITYEHTDGKLDIRNVDRMRLRIHFRGDGFEMQNPRCLARRQ
jgi:hypothetical protein